VLKASKKIFSSIPKIYAVYIVYIIEVKVKNRKTSTHLLENYIGFGGKKYCLTADF